MSICEPRTDAASVQKISGSTLDSDTIDAFIESASLIVDGIADSATDAGVTEEQLTAAECWLTAHLLSMSKVGQSDGTNLKKREKFENYDIEWATGMARGDGVLASHYGTVANSLTKGFLQEMDKRNVGIFFAGSAC